MSESETPISYKILENQMMDHIGTYRHFTITTLLTNYSYMINQYSILYQCLAISSMDKILNKKIKEDINETGNFQKALDEVVLLSTASMTSFFDLINRTENVDDKDCFNNLRENTLLLMQQKNNAFLRKLRQYLNHYGVMPWRFNWLPEEILRLDVESEILLLFNSWNTNDKQVINDLQGDITLELIVKEYIIAMENIWIPGINNLFHLNSDDLETVNKMRKDIFLSLTGGNFSTPEELFQKMEENFKKKNRLV